MKKIFSLLASFLTILCLSVPVFATGPELNTTGRTSGLVRVTANVDEGYKGPIQVTLKGEDRDYLATLIEANGYEDKVHVPFGEYEVLWVRVQDNVRYIASADVPSVLVSVEEDGAVLVTVEPAADLFEAENYESEALSQETPVSGVSGSESQNSDSQSSETGLSDSISEETSDLDTPSSEPASSDSDALEVKKEKSPIRNTVVSIIGTAVFVGIMIVGYLLLRKIGQKL